MKLSIEVHYHFHNAADAEILSTLKRLESRVIAMSADLSRITAEVTEMSSAVDSAVALLGSMAQQIRDNATDPVALRALADTLDSKGTELANAVVANTPADESEG